MQLQICNGVHFEFNPPFGFFPPKPVLHRYHSALATN